MFNGLYRLFFLILIDSNDSCIMLPNAVYFVFGLEKIASDLVEIVMHNECLAQLTHKSRDKDFALLCASCVESSNHHRSVLACKNPVNEVKLKLCGYRYIRFNSSYQKENKRCNFLFYHLGKEPVCSFLFYN